MWSDTVRWWGACWISYTQSTWTCRCKSFVCTACVCILHKASTLHCFLTLVISEVCYLLFFQIYCAEDISSCLHWVVTHCGRLYSYFSNYCCLCRPTHHDYKCWWWSWLWSVPCSYYSFLHFFGCSFSLSDTLHFLLLYPSIDLFQYLSFFLTLVFVLVLIPS